MSNFLNCTSYSKILRHRAKGDICLNESEHRPINTKVQEAEETCLQDSGK